MAPEESTPSSPAPDRATTGGPLTQVNTSFNLPPYSPSMSSTSSRIETVASHGSSERIFPARSIVLPNRPSNFSSSSPSVTSPEGRRGSASPTSYFGSFASAFNLEHDVPRVIPNRSRDHSVSNLGQDRLMLGSPLYETADDEIGTTSKDSSTMSGRSQTATPGTSQGESPGKSLSIRKASTQLQLILTLSIERPECACERRGTFKPQISDPQAAVYHLKQKLS